MVIAVDPGDIRKKYAMYKILCTEKREKDYPLS
jgi:hypothetical protein